MSLISTAVKPFQAKAFKQGKFIDVTEADMMDKWSVVFFYPADFTFVCPTELEDLADNYAEFQKLGVEIYAVSTDTHFSHKAWHDMSPAIKKIDYVMIGDPTHAISRNFDVLIEDAGLADRGTFVVDPDGIDPDRRDHRRRHRPRRQGAAAQDQGRAICRRPPRRSLPGQMA